MCAQVCIYTNAAFLAAADSKRFVLFNVKDGNFVGVIQIPNHLERNKGQSFWMKLQINSLKTISTYVSAQC